MKINNEKLSVIVAEKFKKEIKKMNIGDKFPTESELVVQFSISSNTIRESIKILQAEGMLEVRQGDETYIKSIVALSDYKKAFELLLDRFEIAYEEGNQFSYSGGEKYQKFITLNDDETKFINDCIDYL